MKDVHNLIHRIRKASKDGPDLNTRVKALLDEFVQTRGNVARVYTDETDVASCITLQTEQMRKFATVYPEILVIDSTHGTNSSRYKLFSFMVQDGYGKGQFVQHNLLNGETKVW